MLAAGQQARCPHPAWACWGPHPRTNRQRRRCYEACFLLLCRCCVSLLLCHILLLCLILLLCPRLLLCLILLLCLTAAVPHPASHSASHSALPLLLGVAQPHTLLLLTATPIPHSIGDTCRSVAVPVTKQGLPADWAVALRDHFAARHAAWAVAAVEVDLAEQESKRRSINPVCKTRCLYSVCLYSI